MTTTRSIADLPGPPRLPLLGNAHQLARTSRLHLTAEGWARRYGPIIRVDVAWVGGRVSGEGWGAVAVRVVGCGEVGAGGGWR